MCLSTHVVVRVWASSLCEYDSAANPPRHAIVLSAKFWSIFSDFGVFFGQQIHRVPLYSNTKK